MRALLSVYDKTGIVELASQLHALGVELVSSGGTASAIRDGDIPVTDLADFTGFPPMLGHRVVTLHPKVHGGLLADRRDPAHLTDLETYGIDLIDLVVGNLYPFNSDPGIELIDIGGPTLLRAGAKNFEYVTVVVDPVDYPLVLAEIEEAGSTKPSTRRKLARKAFAHTADYDASIVAWMDGGIAQAKRLSTDPDVPSTEAAEQPEGKLPEVLSLNLEKVQNLRYGENPHQQGARYRVNSQGSWWDSVIQHSGMDLSYLNLFDADAAWSLVHDLGGSAAVTIIKHANPCGAAVAPELSTAYERAFAADPVSAFGGIVALNRPVDLATVEAMEAAAQADVIIAPGYEEGVVERLIAKRKNTRLLEASAPSHRPRLVRQLSDSFLVQENYRFESTPSNWKVVTERQPSREEMLDAQLAWRVCGHVTSNAIVYAMGGVAVGIGAGQQNRVQSAQIAAAKADGRAEGGVCASDAFYPFRDGVDAAADAGVAVVIQPGGSVNDADVIAAADERGISMVFTGERQFRH